MSFHLFLQEFLYSTCFFKRMWAFYAASPAFAKLQALPTKGSLIDLPLGRYDEQRMFTAVARRNDPTFEFMKSSENIRYNSTSGSWKETAGASGVRENGKPKDSSSKITCDGCGHLNMKTSRKHLQCTTCHVLRRVKTSQFGIFLSSNTNTMCLIENSDMTPAPFTQQSPLNHCPQTPHLWSQSAHVLNGILISQPIRTLYGIIGMPTPVILNKSWAIQWWSDRKPFNTQLISPRSYWPEHR